MELKLLALKINKKNSYVKNLKENVLYQFTNDFEFVYDPEKKGKQDKSHNNIIEIKRLDSYPQDLYDIEHDRGLLNVNITAILGKNGAGKSTILELLYLLIYCLSERKKYLKDRDDNSMMIERKQLVEYHEQMNSKIEEILAESQIELYYKFGDNFYLIANSGKQTNFYCLKEKRWEIEEFDRNKFFYTICVNYSLHGLNSNGSYFWLNGLFHKNDGYKTPLVLTPWRDSGNININTELHLAQTRVLTNLLSESFDSENIIDNKVIAGLEFKILPENIGKVDRYSLAFIYRHTKEVNNIDLIELFNILIKSYDTAVKPDLKSVLSFLKYDLGQGEAAEQVSIYSFDYGQKPDKELMRGLLAKYIITKIVKICLRYDDFKPYTSVWSFEKNQVANVSLINESKQLLRKLKADRSHVTLKLKQAVNAFLYGYFMDKDWKRERNPENPARVIFTTNLDFIDFRLMTKNAFDKSKQKKKEVSHFIPTGFFQPVIFVEDTNGKFPFSHLSSGEQQMVHSIHSVLYHMLNLDSLGGSLQKYQAVNLILDEIELYYHPEYQRVFVKKLLDSLAKLKLKCIGGINIIFSTHSPFILSDIPHRNVLKVRAGLPEPFEDEHKTFGSNIHEMLTDAFFLDQNLIGAFAENKIQKCLKSLRLLELGKERKKLENEQNVTKNKTHIARKNEEINQLIPHKSKFSYETAQATEIENQTIYKTINIIGEPVVKYKLLEMYYEILAVENNDKAKAKREIQEIMQRSGIRKEDI